jgi:hypothetical protein
MGQALNTLVKNVAKMTAPEPAPAVQYRLQQVESDSNSDDELLMANLSLADASTRPTYSHVKSDPQATLPAHESISELMNPNIPVHSSAEEVPQHLHEGVILDEVPPFFPATHPPESYSRGNKADAIRGPAVLNTYDGSLNKYDNPT